jgi:hypothetical protein
VPGCSTSEFACQGDLVCHEGFCMDPACVDVECERGDVCRGGRSASARLTAWSAPMIRCVSLAGASIDAPTSIALPAACARTASASRPGRARLHARRALRGGRLRGGRLWGG